MEKDRSNSKKKHKEIRDFFKLITQGFSKGISNLGGVTASLGVATLPFDGGALFMTGAGAAT